MLLNKTITFFQVDSFTGEPFKGNPAGVCILDDSLDDITMQNIASEMNLSETAFAVPITAGNIINAFKFNLRWFTPQCEVDLCGHATLATARVLYDIYEIKADTITFDTKSGDLHVERISNQIQLDFPAGDPLPVELPDYFKSALKLYEFELADSFHEAFQCSQLKMLLVRLKNAEAVKRISPDFNSLIQAEEAFGSKGVIVTAAGDKPYDFTSRFFAPGLGINEDPVTGAAHTVLCPYWSVMLNKTKMRAYQASKRGGELTVELKKDSKGFNNRALLTGQAVIVIEGVIRL